MAYINQQDEITPKRNSLLLSQSGFYSRFIMEGNLIPDGLRLPGNFRVEELLAQGNGLSWLAVDTRNGSNKYVLSLVPHYTTIKGALERFKDNFPNIHTHQEIPAFQVSGQQANNLGLIISEYLEGSTLKELLSQNRLLRSSDVKRLLAELTPALQSLHEANLVHAGVCPATLVLNRGTWRIGSFGTLLPAKAAYPEYFQVLMGQNGPERIFCAPELVYAGTAITQTDFYSLGATLIEAITDVPLTELYSVLNADWVWRNRIVEIGFPQDLLLLLDIMIETEPTRRPQSCTKLLAALSKRRMIRVLPDFLSANPVIRSSCYGIRIGAEKSFQLHNSPIADLALCSKEGVLISAALDGSVVFWNLSDPLVRNGLDRNGTKNFRSMRYCDGFVAFAWNNGIAVYQVATFKLVVEIGLGELGGSPTVIELYNAAPISDNNRPILWLAVATEDYKVGVFAIFHTETPVSLTQFRCSSGARHGSEVMNLGFIPQAKSVCLESAAIRKGLKKWEFNNSPEPGKSEQLTIQENRPSAGPLLQWVTSKTGITRWGIRHSDGTYTIEKQTPEGSLVHRLSSLPTAFTFEQEVDHGFVALGETGKIFWFSGQDMQIQSLDLAIGTPPTALSYSHAQKLLIVGDNSGTILHFEVRFGF